MPESQEIASLRQALQAAETRLEGEISLAMKQNALTIANLESNTKDFQSDASQVLDALKGEVGRLKGKADRPWFRTPSFWAGFLALPGLILAGWIIKAAFGDPAMLRLIHKGFGTEIALGEAIGRGSDLNDTVEKALAQKIAADGSPIGSAISQTFDKSFVRQEAFSVQLAKALQTEIPTMHLDIVEVGLVDQDKLFAYNGDDEHDLGRVGEATTVFSAVPGQKVRIDVGLVTVGFNLDAIESMNSHLVLDTGDDSELSLPDANVGDAIVDTAYEPSDISEILAAELGGEPIIFTKQPIKHVRRIGGQTLEFWSYSAEEVPIEKRQGSEEFPLQTLSFSTISDEDFFARIAVIVSRID